MTCHHKLVSFICAAAGCLAFVLIAFVLEITYVVPRALGLFGTSP